MGRLIDADAISFRCSYGGMCIGDIEDCKTCIHYVCDYEDIQNVLTAYDVEKVVEEIHNYFCKIIDDYNTENIPDEILKYNKEICNIVKRGGVDD